MRLGEHLSHGIWVHLPDFFDDVTCVTLRVRCVRNETPGGCAELVVKVVKLPFAVDLGHLP